GDQDNFRSGVGERLPHAGAGAPAHSVAGRGRRLGIAALCRRSDQRKLLREILAVAGQTERRLARHDERLELPAAIAAAIGVDRHWRSFQRARGGGRHLRHAGRSRKSEGHDARLGMRTKPPPEKRPRAMTAARRLAAILAADVAGYSRLMGEDEAGTAKIVCERREAATPILRAFGGRVVKTTGDGVLLEFPSVVAAVESAILIQKMM